MSRRRGEFEHRTSIFEGAYRAWSHLGGIDPVVLNSSTASDLDPIDHPLVDDDRLKDVDKAVIAVEDLSGNTVYYPYEALPRTGLLHPFVQAIITPWLGPDANEEDISVGLSTLRTWWQHRRKGESSSAKTALRTEKMIPVVEGYAKHFFNLAFSMVMNDGEQPPRTLNKRIKEVEKGGIKIKTMKKKDDEVAAMNIPPRRMMELESTPSNGYDMMYQNQNFGSEKLPSRPGCCSETASVSLPASNYSGNNMAIDKKYGDPDKTPVVFVSHTGDIQIAMSIHGITCDHCVKIIETVLKGVNGSPSPVKGLLDAAADRELEMVILKIERSSDAKRIAYEAKENLRLVGYDANPKEMGIVDPSSGTALDLGALMTAFDVVAATDAKDVFDWTLFCSCPDNGILRRDCARHSQMNRRIFEAFDMRQEKVKDFMGGCGKKYGLPCSCGPNCKCGGCGCAAQKNNQQQQANGLSSGNQMYSGHNNNMNGMSDLRYYMNHTAQQQNMDQNTPQGISSMNLSALNSGNATNAQYAHGSFSSEVPMLASWQQQQQQQQMPFVIQGMQMQDGSNTQRMHNYEDQQQLPQSQQMLMYMNQRQNDIQQQQMMQHDMQQQSVFSRNLNNQVDQQELMTRMSNSNHERADISDTDSNREKNVWKYH